METLFVTYRKNQSRELSENQCGMETARRVSMWQSPQPVEREPMWDGNALYINGIKEIEGELSENQCGMET